MIERSIMNDSQNAQSLTPALSQRERVRTDVFAVANYGKIKNHNFTIVEHVWSLICLVCKHPV